MYRLTTDHDMYSITRDGSADFHSAEVDVDSSSTNRNLSLNQMDGLFQQLWTRGGNPKVMLTGYDTLMSVQQLLQSQQRFMDSKSVTPTFNGVKGVPGIEAGFIVATYNGVPIIPTKDMPQDGAVHYRVSITLTQITCGSKLLSQPNTTKAVLKPATHSRLTVLDKRGFTELWENYGVLSLVLVVAFVTYNEVIRYGSKNT